jgi:hypothetical protein
VLHNSPELLSQLDPQEISSAIIAAMISSLGDGKPDNFIYLGHLFHFIL